MKNLLKTILIPMCAAVAVTACSDWTDTEQKDATDLTKTNRSEAYYANLRKYKQTDHAVTFGYFGNWVGSGASLENSLAGLPDSVDFVSIWGNWQNISEAKQKDLKYVQQVKGTKALICFLVLDIGDQITPPVPDGYTGTNWKHDFWGWGSTPESKLAATEKYANAICDTIDKYGYDGFDLDAEPHFSHPFTTYKELWTDPDIMETFVKTMGKRIGPKSGTNRIFAIDGEPNALAPEFGEYFDYFILQTYGLSSASALTSRFNTQRAHFSSVMSAEEVAKRIIVVENFENWASSGGVNATLPDGSSGPSLWLFAQWNPTYGGKTLRKGGVGSYHMEYEYRVSGKDETYPYLRKATQMMNPTIK